MVGFWLGLASFLLLILRHLFTKQEPRMDLPHGSMGWPLLGETLGYLKPHKANSTGRFIQEHCSKYGKVFKSHLFGTPTIVSCDLELNMFILQNEDKLFQTFYPKSVHEILGKLSILHVTGDLHKKIRNVAVSFINNAKSRPDFLQCVEKLSISLIKSWKERQQVLFYKEVKAYTMYNMLKHMLNIEPEEPVALKILEDFLTFMKGLVSLPLYIPGSPYARAVKARARLSSLLKEIMEKRGKRAVGLEKTDFLDEVLLKGNLDIDETVSVVMDILLAGFESTAGLLALIVYFLEQTPSALEQLKEEHLTLRRSKKDGEPLSWENYKQMEFTSKVIREALRCGNLTKFVHRKALQDVKFKGYLIPAGWQVLPVFNATHFDPSVHKNPLEFDPWRWDDEDVSKKVTFFGGGPRLCPGAEFAKVTTAVFLHHLVLNYRWKTKEDDFPMSCPYFYFKRGLPLEIEPTQKIISTKA